MSRARVIKITEDDIRKETGGVYSRGERIYTGIEETG